MVCSVAFFVWVLGYMPKPGTVITVPKAQADQYSIAEQYKARRCARRYGIELRVSE